VDSLKLRLERVKHIFEVRTKKLKRLYDVSAIGEAICMAKSKST